MSDKSLKLSVTEAATVLGVADTTIRRWFGPGLVEYSALLGKLNLHRRHGHECPLSDPDAYKAHGPLSCDCVACYCTPRPPQVGFIGECSRCRRPQL